MPRATCPRSTRLWSFLGNAAKTCVFCAIRAWGVEGTQDEKARPANSAVSSFFMVVKLRQIKQSRNVGQDDFQERVKGACQLRIRRRNLRANISPIETCPNFLKMTISPPH
jgi:hypothetical protein